MLIDTAVLAELAVGPTEGERELLIDAAVLAELAVGPTEGESELLIDAAVLAELAVAAEREGELLIETAVLEEPTVGPTKREGELLIDTAVLTELAVAAEGERGLLIDTAVLKELAVAAEGEGLATEGEGELLRGVAGLEASNCACLARLLVAAFVCQPHEHALFAERWKNDPCLHLFIEAIAAKTSLLDGFWPLPANAGRPSARSIN